MTKFVVKNNVESTVADDPLTQSSTTLHVPTGEGSNFPSTFPFMLTIWNSNIYPDPGNDPGMEIVKCTNRSNDTLTIVRAQENTSNMEHLQGERVAMLITAGVIDVLISEVVDDTSPQLGGDLDPNGHGFAIGSDADGDMYYRASGALTRLAKGSASQVLTMNGSGTAPEWTDVSGSDLPVVDTTSIVSGSSDSTKQMRFEVDGLTTNTTRVMTVPDKDITLADNADVITHTSAANPHSGSAASGANSDITSLSGLTTPLSVAQGGTGVTDDSYDADKVDGCDAGLGNGNVLKIDNYMIATGAIISGLGTQIGAIDPGIDGYQLTTHGSSSIVTWAPASDLIFSDTHCPKCNKKFKIGDILILYVVGYNEVGDILTIPMHKECAETPKKIVMIKRKVFENRYILDELTGKTKIQRVQKTQKKTITKYKLKDGYEFDHKTGKAIKINKDGSKDKTQYDLSIALETFEDTIKEPIYKDVEFIL